MPCDIILNSCEKIIDVSLMMAEEEEEVTKAAEESERDSSLGYQ
jgi:hypothetical protein